jgi:hypothetical protein
VTWRRQREDTLAVAARHSCRARKTREKRKPGGTTASKQERGTMKMTMIVMMTKVTMNCTPSWLNRQTEQRGLVSRGSQGHYYYLFIYLFINTSKFTGPEGSA